MEIPGEKLVIKLWETLTDKGIGNLLKPWQIRREGRASTDVRREELLALAQAERDVAAIRSGEKLLLPTGELVDRLAHPAPEVHAVAPEVRPFALPYVAVTAEQNARVEAVRQEVSVAKAVLHAEHELKGDAAVPPERKPDDDWLLRWRECAAGVSSEELQLIWGKVLAGEVKAPGRFSLRTLEFLRNLSQAEAQAIERISPFVVASFVFRDDDPLLESEGIKFADLLALQELGVLAGVDGLGLQVTISSDIATSFRRALTSHGAVLLVTAADAEKTIKLKACKVTTIGGQVLRLGHFSPNAKMLESIAATIKEQGFEVQLGSYIQIGEGQLQAFNLRAL